MLEYFKENPLQLAVLFAALFICIFAWVKAMRAAKKRTAARTALIETLEYEKKLRTEFRTLDRDVMIQTPPERLVEGVCSHIQLRFDEAASLQEAFAALAEHERLIYALGYVVQDGRKGLSAFFRANGKPLTPAALEAVERLIGGEYATVFRKTYDAFDEANESVSLIDAQLRAWDEAYESILRGNEDEVYAEAKEYILAHF